MRAAGWLYICIYYIYARNTIATLILRRRCERDAEGAVVAAAVAIIIARIEQPSARTIAIVAAPVEPRVGCNPKVHVLAIPHMTANISAHAIVCFI